jgi:hypothetical protein
MKKIDVFAGSRPIGFTENVEAFHLREELRELTIEVVGAGLVLLILVGVIGWVGEGVLAGVLGMAGGVFMAYLGAAGIEWFKVWRRLRGLKGRSE